MQIIKEQFQTKIVGKCLKENIAKKYARDNKLKIAEARRLVVRFLYEEVTNDNRKNNTRCKSE